MKDSSEVQPLQLSSQSFKEALLSLEANPYPHVANPPNCKKRASVAFIIRIRPAHGQSSKIDASNHPSLAGFSQRLHTFFDQPWVRSGTPEVLFIKRAARASDRWGGHVAFPGGTREDSDPDDCATSVRETEEEIGLSLAEASCLKIGNLPQRIVTAAWGKKPLMVLCPFVFLLLHNDVPPLDPQPTEVGSVHWVPLCSILAWHLRSCQTATISDRVVPLQRPFVKRFLQLLGGNLIFAAVKLEPSESKSAMPVGAFLEGRAGKTARKPMAHHVHMSQQPLLLWGLTLGMLADFLHIIDAEATKKLWSWPTFEHWDFRFICWLLTRSIRNARSQTNLIPPEQKSTEPFIGDIDATTHTQKSFPTGFNRTINIAGGHTLDEYFERMKQALTAAVGLRLSIGIIVLAITMQKGFRKS